MSRFIRIYEGSTIGDSTIGLTEISPGCIRFECFKIFAIGDASIDRKGHFNWYIAQGYRHSMRDFFWEGEHDEGEETTDVECAQAFLIGYIDDEGNSEISFAIQPLFIRGKDGADQIGDLFVRLYGIAKEHIVTIAGP